MPECLFRLHSICQNSFSMNNNNRISYVFDGIMHNFRYSIILAQILLLLFTNTTSLATNTIIFGKDAKYKNSKIDLNFYNDIISKEPVKLGTFNFSSEGNFKLEINLSEPKYCFADFDGYHGIIYLEPGGKYEIVFPEKRNLTESQKRNPFAKSEQVWFAVLNQSAEELNHNIQKFEQYFAILENKYFDQIFVYQNKSIVDSLKSKLRLEFPETKNAYYEKHKKYRIAALDFALNKGKGIDFQKDYFEANRPVNYNEAYASLFNQVFINYFNILLNTEHSTELRNLINSGSATKLDVFFQEKLKCNKELSRLIILKSLNDAYYNNSFSKNSILKLLQSVKLSDWPEYEKRISEIIINKLTYLSSGTDAPLISLSTIDGKRISLKDFPGKYIYLHFTDQNNPICQQHLDYLKTIEARYKDKIVIINILHKPSGFSNSKNWPGIFTEGNKTVEQAYKVKTYPTSYLVNKNGKLLLSPAPNPIDGLDRQIGQILKSDFLKERQGK